MIAPIRLRHLLLILALLAPPLSGQSYPSLEIPQILEQHFGHLSGSLQQRFAFAFPPPTDTQLTFSQSRPLLPFALVQLALMMALAIWWRLRLGRWALY